MEITFVTYNIHKAIGTDRLYRPDRIISVLEELNPDILALQEVPRDVPHAGHDDTAVVISEALGFYHSSGLNVHLKRGAYGNATLSRFPIESSSNLNITWSIKKPRGCLNTRVLLPNDRPLAVMNFHLGLSGIERRKQIHKVLRSPFLLKHQDIPLVLLGDTNDAYNRLRRLMKVGGLRDTMQDNTRRGGRTFPSFAPIWKLDRMYFSGNLLPVEQRVIRNNITRIASDHLPLYVRFRLL